VVPHFCPPSTNLITKERASETNGTQPAINIGLVFNTLRPNHQQNYSHFIHNFFTPPQSPIRPAGTGITERRLQPAEPLSRNQQHHSVSSTAHLSIQSGRSPSSSEAPYPAALRAAGCGGTVLHRFQRWQISVIDSKDVPALQITHDKSYQSNVKPTQGHY
jgi:hypothetical protein